MTRRRGAAIAELIAELSLTRPLALASVLDAVVEAAGEPTDAQWWQLFEAAAKVDPGHVLHLSHAAGDAGKRALTASIDGR